MGRCAVRARRHDARPPQAVHPPPAQPEALSGLRIKGHDGDHEEIEQQFRRILGNPAIPARDRVRLSCALGALLSSLMTVSNLGDLSIET